MANTKDLPGLLADTEGFAIAYSVLGATFCLEPLRARHEESLERIGALVMDWFGKELRWTTGSMVNELERFEPEHLEYVSTYASNLDVEVEPGPNELAQLEAEALTLTEYSLYCHGGNDQSDASPFTLAFYADIPEVEVGHPLNCVSMLRVSVPEDWPLDDFERRVAEIAASTPMRWGSAGYTVIGNEVTFNDEFSRAAYAQARRCPGYDIANDSMFLDSFRNQIRSVNWLTMLGDSIGSKLLPLEGNALVSIERAGDCTIFKAGESPQRGSHNRFDVPQAYVQVDQMLRGIRASSGMDFLEPWTEQTTEQWLRRFEG